MQGCFKIFSQNAWVSYSRLAGLHLLPEGVRDELQCLSEIFSGTEVSRPTARGSDGHDSCWVLVRARLFPICGWIPQSSHKDIFVDVCYQIIFTEQEEEQKTSYFSISLTLTIFFKTTILLPPSSFFFTFNLLTWREKWSNQIEVPQPWFFLLHHTVCSAIPLISISWKNMS